MTYPKSRAHDNATREGVALAHTLYGQPANSQPANSIGGNIGPALFSTAPYKPPKRRVKDNGKALCSEPDCRSYPATGKDYCAGHARKHGQMPTCAQRDCGSPPLKGQKLCFHHQPKVQEIADDDTG